MNPQLGTIDSSTWPEEPATPPPRRFPIGIALLIATTFLAGIALAFADTFWWTLGFCLVAVIGATRLPRRAPAEQSSA